MYLFFDTETTGLPRSHNAPISDLGNWPRVVQLAWLLADDTGAERARGGSIILPEGFTIPEPAAAVHGITTARALREGKALRGTLDAFHGQLGSARTLVAHNFDFDQRVLAAEYLRAGLDHSPLMNTTAICTMRRTTDYCRIPNERGGYKWPRLMELHTHLFGEGFESAHDAMADVQACARCFFELRQRGLFSP